MVRQGQGGGVFLGMRDLYNKVLGGHPSWPTYFYLAKGELGFTTQPLPEAYLTTTWTLPVGTQSVLVSEQGSPSHRSVGVGPSPAWATTDAAGSLAMVNAEAVAMLPTCAQTSR